MVFLRMSYSSRAVRGARLQSLSAYRSFTTNPRLLAQQGYGDGKGDPVASDPQKQPAQSEATHSAEHPGPDPPDVGKGTGAGPTKAAFSEGMNKAAAKESPEDASAKSGGSRSKEAAETGSSPTGGDVANNSNQPGGEALKGPKGKGSPQPKIHNQSVPGVKEALSKEQKQEVEQHNKDFEKRHDRASPASEDKVNKKFWQGSAGSQASKMDWNA